MRSKENELNFTDYKQLNCYRYIEENDTIEEGFYQSDDSKLCKLFTTCYVLIFYFILFNLFYFIYTVINKQTFIRVDTFECIQIEKDFQVFENVLILSIPQQFSQRPKGL